MFIQKIQSKIIINELMLGSNINNRQRSIPFLYTATNNLKMQLKNSIYTINKNCKCLWKKVQQNFLRFKISKSFSSVTKCFEGNLPEINFN